MAPKGAATLLIQLFNYLIQTYVAVVSHRHVRRRRRSDQSVMSVSTEVMSGQKGDGGEREDGVGRRGVGGLGRGWGEGEGRGSSMQGFHTYLFVPLHLGTRRAC